MIVVLLGYMGSGKSTVGIKLAAELDYDFMDLDAFIEDQEQLSISELFERRGHIEFRKIEAKAVQKICRTHTNLVLALGGGTPCYGNTMDFLNQHPSVCAIYLKSSVKTLANRLVKEKSKRPLIANINDDDLAEFIAKHLFERSRFYNQAQLTLNIDDRPVEPVVQEICNDLDEYNL
jgi:shikimate kinase